MIDLDRAFSVATDETLVHLIQRARQRLIVVSPALTDPVANALAIRLGEKGSLVTTVILDTDPEVYRLGYGTQAALDRVRSATERNLLDLRVQSGLRIGVIISDDITLAF